MTVSTSHRTKQGTYSHEEGSPCGICDALYDRIHNLEVQLTEAGSDRELLMASRALVAHLRASLEVYYGGKDEGWTAWNKRIQQDCGKAAMDALALTEEEMMG